MYSENDYIGEEAGLFLQIDFSAFKKSGIIRTVMESWQSGNATDSKSVEPAYTGAQVQILYSP